MLPLPAVTCVPTWTRKPDNRSWSTDANAKLVSRTGESSLGFKCVAWRRDAESGKHRTSSAPSLKKQFAGSLAVASTATRFASCVACFHTLLPVLYVVNQVMLMSASDIIALIDTNRLNQHRQRNIRSLNN